MSTTAGRHSALTVAPPTGKIPFDQIVASIYRAGAGLEPWGEPLQRIAQAFDLWLTQFFSLDKRMGTVIFSFEGGHSNPETAFDWFHKYHRIDPRVDLVTRARVGEWIACDEHLDEKFVAQSPFYQEFLIPYGGRYVYAGKLLEDESQMVVLSFLRGIGSPQLNATEREQVTLLAWHIKEAFNLQAEVGKANEGRLLGLAMLDRMRQPLLVLDSNRRIVFANSSGRALLEKGDILEDKAGYAICRDAHSEVLLMYALRELILSRGADGSAPAGADRRGLRLGTGGRARHVAATLLALRPQQVLGAFGSSSMAMLAIYQPGAETSMDPFLLETTFDLTPAEARVAAKLVSGLSIKDVAAESGVSPVTVRTQLKNIFAKTGTNRQADLIRVLVLASEF